MSKQSSVDAAVLVLADAKGDRFRLTCSCGWQTHENRDWVKHRIERHFAWPDAEPTEHVITEVVTANE